MAVYRFIKINTAIKKNCEYLLFQLNLKYDMTLSCQCPHDKAKNTPVTKPINFPFGFCSAIQLIAFAYYYENPTSTYNK